MLKFRALTLKTSKLITAWLSSVCNADAMKMKVTK